MKKTTKLLFFIIPILLIPVLFLPIIKTEKSVYVYTTEKVDEINKQDIDRLSSEFGAELEFGRFQNNLISKHLPKLTFFSTNKPRRISQKVYLINSDGTSAYCYPGRWAEVEVSDNARMFHNQEYSDFLVSQDLFINNQQDAIEMVVLLQTIASYQYQYPNVRISVPKQHICLFRILLNKLTGQWYYWAEQTETGWQAGRGFRSGLIPVSIVRPLVYIFELDNQNKVINLSKGFWGRNKLPAKNPDES